MKWVHKLKSIFVKKDKTDTIFVHYDNVLDDNISCEDCKFKKYCNDIGNVDRYCKFLVDGFDLSDFDKSKNTLLIIDDHEGMTSFLEDDIEEILEDKDIDKTFNIITITTNKAGYIFEALSNKFGDLHIIYAIIDITFGGSEVIDDVLTRYTGVDVFEKIYNKKLKYIFYTGNNLNKNIKSNKNLIDKFEKITGENINDHILQKTSLDMETRQKFIYELFKD